LLTDAYITEKANTEYQSPGYSSNRLGALGGLSTINPRSVS
jgi:hypothetical protein